MKTNFDRVRDFRRKFDLPSPSGARLLTDEAFLFRLDLMTEELHETLKAHRAGNLEKFADGLGDLLYMVYGTAVEAGIPMDEVFAEIHRANMEKVRETRSDGPRSSTFDIVKPPGWEPPDIAGVLELDQFIEENR